MGRDMGKVGGRTKQRGGDEIIVQLTNKLNNEIKCKGKYGQWWYGYEASAGNMSNKTEFHY
jgi:hypothetical protein